MERKRNSRTGLWFGALLVMVKNFSRKRGGEETKAWKSFCRGEQSFSCWENANSIRRRESDGGGIKRGCCPHPPKKDS